MVAPLPTTFYAVDSARPIRAYSRSWFGAWSALSASLADHFGADAESFSTVEAYWNGDREYAELVMLDGRVVGALNRPISAADVAAMGRDRSMQKRAFMNRIRSLFNIDGCLLPELTSGQQLEFLRDPVRYFLNTDEAQSDAIMREVENRQKGEVSDARGDLSTVTSVVDRPAAQGHAKEWEDDGELKVVKKPATAKAPRAKKSKLRVEGQREMLLPIPGGKPEEKRSAKVPAARRKAG